MKQFRYNTLIIHTQIEVVMQDLVARLKSAEEKIQSLLVGL